MVKDFSPVTKVASVKEKTSLMSSYASLPSPWKSLSDSLIKTLSDSLDVESEREIVKVVPTAVRFTDVASEPSESTKILVNLQIFG